MPFREFENKRSCDCRKFDSSYEFSSGFHAGSRFDETARFVSHMLKKLERISYSLNAEAESLTAAVEEGLCCYSKLLFSAQLKNNRCAAYLSSMKSLYENMLKNLKIKEAASNMLKAYILNNSSSSVIDAVKTKVKECDAIQEAIERRIESVAGDLEVEVIELTGFTRICPDDEFLVTFQYADQRSRLRCKVRSDNMQIWSGNKIKFSVRLKVPLYIKVSELKRFAMWSVIGTTHVDALKLFEEYPSDIVMNANDSGTIKIHLTIKWIRIFDEPFDELSKSSTLLSVANALRPVIQTKKPTTDLKSLSFERSKPRSNFSFRSVPSSHYPLTEANTMNQWELALCLESSLITSFFAKVDSLCNRFEEVRKLKMEVIKALKLLKQPNGTFKQADLDAFMDCFDFLNSEADLQFVSSIPDSSNRLKPEGARQFVGQIESSHDSGFGSLPRPISKDNSEINFACELNSVISYHLRICLQLLSKLESESNFTHYIKSILSALSDQTDVFNQIGSRQTTSILDSDNYLSRCWSSVSTLNSMMVPVDAFCLELQKQIFVIVDEEYVNSDTPFLTQQHSSEHDSEFHRNSVFRKSDLHSSDRYSLGSPNHESVDVRKLTSSAYLNPGCAAKSNLFHSLVDGSSALEFFTKSFDVKQLKSRFAFFRNSCNLTSALSETFLTRKKFLGSEQFLTHNGLSYSENCLLSSHASRPFNISRKHCGYYCDNDLFSSSFTIDSAKEYFKKQYCIDFCFDEMLQRIFLPHLLTESGPRITAFQIATPFRKLNFLELTRCFCRQALVLQKCTSGKETIELNCKPRFIADKFLKTITKFWLEANVHKDIDKLPFYNQVKSLLPSYYEVGLKSDDFSHRLMCVLAVERLEMINFRQILESVSLNDNSFHVKQAAVKVLNKWKVPSVLRYSNSGL